MPNAHFLPRSKGGLGIKENIVTLCFSCHYKADQTTDRLKYLEFIKSYLSNLYPEYSRSYEIAYQAIKEHSSYILTKMDKDKRIYYVK